MANQYTKLSASNIRTKMNRKNNPVTSMTQLAREFGFNTTYTRKLDWFGREGRTDTRAPESFCKRVKALVGEKTYNEIRRSHNVNKLYR